MQREKRAERETNHTNEKLKYNLLPQVLHGLCHFVGQVQPLLLTIGVDNEVLLRLHVVLRHCADVPLMIQRPVHLQRRSSSRILSREERREGKREGKREEKRERGGTGERRKAGGRGNGHRKR